METKIQTSETFRKYIKMFPDSIIAKQYAQYGDKYLNSAGHFCTALWKGDIEEALRRADSNNLELLKRLLSF